LITVIDSGIANIGSVVAAFGRIAVPVRVTAEPGQVRAATALVLPGVGSFPDGMASLRRNRLVDPIRAATAAGIPLLGICLGMQLLADVSEEFGEHEGLGLLSARVVRLTPADRRERVPNMGWCDVSAAPEATLFSGIPAASSFYFVHSYHLVCSQPQHAVAFIGYGASQVCAAAQSRNLYGVQFHPDKSQDGGLALLHNYARLVANL
jgi:imidazole glycerol-phosphate synthase subunit HisH